MTNSGPPDLDELWRKLVNKFKPGSLNSIKNNMGKPSGISKSFIFSIIACICTFWLLSGLYLVQANQNAIVFRFNAFNSISGPGLHWHIPYPVESHKLYVVTEIKTVDIVSNESVNSLNRMLTSDENIVNLAASVQYSVKNIKDFAFNNVDTANQMIIRAALSSLREAVGLHSMDYVLYEGRKEISLLAQKSIQNILDSYNAGIYINRLNLLNAQPPEPVQAAFSDAVKAVQDQARRKNEGQAYAFAIIPKAEAEAFRMLANANSYKVATLNKANSDIFKFNALLGQFNKMPHEVKFKIYSDAMSQIIQKAPVYYVNSQRILSGLAYIPSLPSLIHRAEYNLQKPIDLNNRSNINFKTNPRPSIYLNRQREYR